MNSILIILFSLLPALLYLLIIYWTTPYKSWSYGKSINYLIFGSLSVGIIFFFHKHLPFYEIYKIGNTNVDRLFLYSFIEIALTEELVKYVFYILYFKVYDRIVKAESHPLSTMIYCGSVALGFAFIENIKYASDYGIYILMWRSVTSVIAHMSFGFMMGYWISLYKHKLIIRTNPINSYEGVSIFDLVIRRFPKLKSFFYTLMGILMATFFHGLYDFNLIGIENSIISTTINFIIIGSMITIILHMAKNLIKINNKKNKNYEQGESI